MFRPRRSPLWLLLLAATPLLPACHTMYRDVYAPKRNFYKPPQEKATVINLDEKPSTPAPPVAVPPGVDAAGQAPLNPPAAPAEVPGLPPPPPPAQ